MFVVKKWFFSQLLKAKLEHKIPGVQLELKNILKDHGDKAIDQVTLDSVIHGMKELPLMFYPCSSLDPEEGIWLRGYSIPQIQEGLPKINNQPLPEAVFWLLLTGEIPNDSELADIQKSLTQQVDLPSSTIKLIKLYAKTHHPMTILSMAILDLQNQSEFFNKYQQGLMKKSDYWIHTYNDAISCLRQLPQICSLIYTKKYSRKSVKIQHLDWAGIFANQLGFKEEKMADLLWAYLTIHCDHEGGNISAHSAFIASSALCDPYLSFTNAVNGLAGPLHGLANQEVLKFLLEMKEAIKNQNLLSHHPSSEQVRDYIRNYIHEYLKTRVVPGYGHGRLRTTDPRYVHLKEMSSKLMSDKYLVNLIHVSEPIIQEQLKQLGKVKNPNPNVDAHSGVLLYELGMKEYNYYTVLFAMSRAIGVFANTIWARALNLPLERPGSLTLEQIKALIK